MKLILKKIPINNAPLKVISLILGYTLWHIFANSHTKSIDIQVPLCFYSVPENHTIKAPDTVTVCLTGKRTQLYALNKKSLAVHINAQNLTPGTVPIAITSESLFLPNTIKLVHYIPSNVQVTVKSVKTPKKEVHNSEHSKTT